MKLQKCLTLIAATAIMNFQFGSVWAADCAQSNTVTDNSTVLTKALWDSEFGNLISCANQRVDETGGTMTGNLNMHNGSDVNWYSDTGTTLKATVDGATGNATFGDLTIGATKKFYLDGGGDTYFTENSGNSLKAFVGGSESLQLSGNDMMLNSATANFGGWVGTADWLGLKATGTNSAFLELTGVAADASGRRNAGIVFNADSQTSGHRSLAVIDVNTDGSTANARGGKIDFYTKGDNTGTLTRGLSIDRNGYVYMPQIRNVTNQPVYFDLSTGEITRASSSRKYKDDINDLDIDSAKIYDLREVTYTEKNDSKENKPRHIGLIAEEVDQVIPELVYHDSEGNPESIHYDRLAILLLAEIRKLNTRIHELEEQIANRDDSETDLTDDQENDNSI